MTTCPRLHAFYLMALICFITYWLTGCERHPERSQLYPKTLPETLLKNEPQNQASQNADKKGQDKPTTEQQIPENSNKAESEINKTFNSADEILIRHWTLHEVHLEAIAGSPQIAVAQQRLAAAMARLDQARGAYLPQINFNASTERRRRRFQGDIEQDNFSPANSSRLDLSGTWLLFDGLQREFTIDAQRFARDADALNRDEVQRQILRAVTASYSDVLQAQRILEVSQRDLELNDEILRTMHYRFKSGLVSRADVDNFEVRANRARLAIITAERDLNLSRAILGEIVGDADLFRGKKHSFAMMTQPGTIPTLRQVETLGVANLPQIKEIEARQQAAQARVRSAYGSWSPDLIATADAGATAPYLTPERQRTESYAIGLSLQWTLLDPGNRPAQIAEAKAEAIRLSEELEQATLQAKRIISDNWQRLADSLAQREYLKINVELSESIYRSTVESYELGQASITRVNQVLAEWVESQRFDALNEIAIARNYHLLYADMGFTDHFSALFAKTANN